MSTAELIRRRLEAGETPGAISKGLGVTKNRVYCIRWRMNNPDYHRTYMRRWRECNPGYEKRRSLADSLRQRRVLLGKQAERVQQVIG